MGSAATYQLAKRGNRVLGIDQFSPPHTFGSSHGDTRVTRLAIGEGDHYIPFALRSHELWREIEKETGRSLLTSNGGLIISSRGKTTSTHAVQFFDKTLAAAEKHNIKHEKLSVERIRKRYPEFNVQDNERGYFEYEAGFVRPEECIRAQLELAKKYGAQIRTEEKVIRFDASDRVVVKTTKGEYRADKLVITAGPWVPQLVDKKHKKYFKIMRQVLFWFDVEDSFKEFTPDKFPVFIWELQDKKKLIYGFPAINGPKGGLKIATEQYETTTTADTVNRNVSQAEMSAMHRNLVEAYLPNVSSKCIKAVSCLYTVTPDFGFVIDFHPEQKNVILASPCSGHGFKHSAAIGEALSELATTGKSRFDLSKFKFDSFIK